MKIALTLLIALKGMLVPEAVYHDEKTGYSFVSNIVGEGWGDDGDGFISILNPDGTIAALRWRQATSDARLSAPKGLCVLNDQLYCADIDVVHRFDLKGPGSSTMPIPGAEHLNDLATDGKAVYASDTERGVVVKIDPATCKTSVIDAVASINGITFGNGKMYCVSWDLHEIYELDPSGETAPKPFGLARHFKNLDGIEVLPGGEIVVSDFRGNSVWMVSADRKTAIKLLDVKTPADIAIDRDGMRLFVPLFHGDEVDIFGPAALKGQ